MTCDAPVGMEVYFIPFHGRQMVYRPLRHQAFLANQAMVDLIRRALETGSIPKDSEAANYLNQIGFWLPDPPPPEPWQPQRRYAPTIAVLLMTSACNLRCVYCYARGGESSGLWMSQELALSAIQRVRQNAREQGANSFELSFHGGGEPTLNWEVLTKAVESVLSGDLDCSLALTSNAMWSRQQREFIIQHFGELSISFDGLPQVQDAQRPRPGGGGSFSQVWENIQALDVAGKSYGLRMTAMTDSFGQLAEGVAMICAQTGCRNIQVEPCYSGQRGGYADPTPEEARAFANSFADAYKVALEADCQLSYSGARPWLLTGCFCRSPESALVVTPEGDLVTCYEMYDRRHPLAQRFMVGSIRDGKVLVEPAKIEDFMQGQAGRREACRQCFCYWHCGGDCASRVLASPDTPRGRCVANRAITLEILAWEMARAQQDQSTG